MLFSEFDRCIYQRSPLIEVICQLRFPPILTIGKEEPAEFQEAIRHDFPKYMPRKEQGAPQMVRGADGKPQMQPGPVMTNYYFLTEDNFWKVNLTSNFVALSTLRYTRWEDFAQRLDKVLAAFIRIYQPSYFSRVGLRYVNAVSKQLLGRQEVLWDDLINQPYIGILSEPDVDEQDVNKCTLDVESKLPGDCRMKIHAGPGLLGGPQKERVPRFILDFDLGTAGDVHQEQVPAKLESLHGYAGGLFHAAITDELHDAMGPIAAD